MKFLKKIPHVEVDISLYDWNSKYIVKFEWNNMEQTYKVGHLDVSSLGEVDHAITESFIAQVLERFEDMQESWDLALGLTL
jgi:hypothetical protein